MNTYNIFYTLHPMQYLLKRVRRLLIKKRPRVRLICLISVNEIVSYYNIEMRNECMHWRIFEIVTILLIISKIHTLP